MTSDEQRRASSQVRFIVLCGPRTGSTMLTSALNSHPAIVCFGEVFNFTVPSIDYAVHGYDGWDERALALRASDAAAFMDRHLFHGHQASISAVGFKFMYDHFWEFPGLIEALQATQDLHIIHLIRRNGVRAFLSYKMAFSTGAWKRRKPRPIHQRVLSTLTHPGRILPSISRRTSSAAPATRVTLPPEECLEYIQTRLDQERHFNRLFAAHPRLDLHYEALLADRKEQFSRAQRFVGVESQLLREEVERQNPGTMRELISNYDELAAALQGTPHAWMLNET